MKTTEIKRNLLKKFIKTIEGHSNILGWPPECSILFYQPKRVKKVSK